MPIMKPPICANQAIDVCIPRERYPFAPCSRNQTSMKIMDGTSTTLMMKKIGTMVTIFALG